MKTLDMMIDEVNKMFDKGSNDLSDRDRTNAELLELLTEYITKYPDQRFGQMLVNLNLTGDVFYEESNVTLNRVKSIMKKFEEIV